MKGLLKWPGGKERELAAFIPYFPNQIDTYYEPFVGGGSVYMTAQAQAYRINDLYGKLAALYGYVISGNEAFRHDLSALNSLWHDVSEFMAAYAPLPVYLAGRHNESNHTTFSQELVSAFEAEVFERYASMFSDLSLDFNAIAHKVFVSKIDRILKHEVTKGQLSMEDLHANFVSAMKAAVYTYLRDAYNIFRKTADYNNALYIAIFYFLRNHCYSSMFRFNKSGDFNVPYGGISYNESYLDRKLERLFELQRRAKYHLTQVSNLDFEVFLRHQYYGPNDFIFLDPPYDTEFSDYGGHSFGTSDQKRLADLLQQLDVRWLMVIKRTPPIEKLFIGQDLSIIEFDKQYQVSFKGRNN